MAEQLGLFGDRRSKAVVDDEEKELARLLPSFIRLGTSSWTFPGWGGIVYEGSPSERDLVRDGLRAYAEHPLFRTVGIDRSYYGPLTSKDLATYAAQLPSGFLAISKVWDEITSLVFPKHPRFGDKAGKRNPGFLDPKRTIEEVLIPYSHAFSEFAGPFVFEMPPAPPGAIGDGEDVARAIDRLLAALPGTFRYAFEVRNPELLTRRYFDVLTKHGAGHVMNMWTAMPTIGEQLALPGAITAGFVIARLLLPPRTRYEQLKDAYAPFNRIVREQPDMRRDVVRLAEACERAHGELWVIANNKAEGSSPLTLRGIAKAIVSG